MNYPWVPTLNPADVAFTNGFLQVSITESRFGGSPDRADNYDAIAAAVAVLNAAGGGVLRIPSAMFAVLATTPIITTAPILIEAEGATLNLAGSTANLFDVRDELEVRSLQAINIPAGFAVFDMTNATVEIPRFEMVGGRYSGAGSYPVFMGNAGPGITKLKIWGQPEFENVQFGVYIWNHIIGGATILGAWFTDCAENGIWLGRDFAASFEQQGEYEIVACHFTRIGDGSVQPDPDRHAIIAFGRRCVVSACEITDVDNDTHGDCEGIYLKCHESVVTKNVLHNAGRGQGCIAIKGQPRGSSTPGHNTIVSDNIITNDAGRVDVSAISIGDPGECTCARNVIDGMTDTPIVVGGTNQTAVTLEDNEIKNTFANVGISLNCPSARVYCENNKILTLDGGAGNAVGILASNSGAAPYEVLRICWNTCDNLTGGGAIVAGVLDNMTPNPSVRDYDILYNIVTNTTDGLYFSAAAPRHERLRIEGNRLEVSGTAVVNHANLLTTRTRFFRNVGFVSEIQGLATFAAATSVVVTHGCDWTRRIDRRIPMPIASGTTPRYFSISAAGTTTFTINADTSTSVTVGWQILPQDEIYT